jgi:hypothetical protein
MPVLPSHEPGISHHVRQAEGWLEKSECGTKTAALSYAALELRYSIERLAVFYWTSLLNRQLTHEEAESIGTYKKLERRLYELGGHQKQIDGHFAFLRSVMNVMKIPGNLPTPNLGVLSEHWHACSEVCHVLWPLGCSAELYRDAVFQKLSEIRDTVAPLVEGDMLGWPVIHDPTFASIRDGFIEGMASEAEVVAYAETHGLWARLYDKKDNHVRFVGEAIPPKTPAASAAGDA